MKTKKLITILSVSCLISSSSFAQQSNTLPSNTDAFGKGTNVINLGIGLGGNYSDIYGGYSSTPNFVISYDNGTFNAGPGIISLGGLFSYKGVSYSAYDGDGYLYSQNWNYYIIGFRSAFHWNFTNSNKFDPYAGLMLAYYDISSNSSYNNPHFPGPGNPYIINYDSYTALSIYLGARYYLSNKVGIWLELGFGYSDAALGVSFKF